MEHVRRITQKEAVVESGREVSLSCGPVVYTHTRRINVPAETFKNNRIITGEDDDGANTAYKMLRTQILHRMKAHQWRSLAITSSGEGEGKTLTAINLAISLARDVNHTVLLVDLDLRRPSVAKYFGYTPSFGLDDYLLDNVPLHETLFNPGIERLVVLPTRRSLLSSSELLSSPSMQHLADELRERYPERLVIFDMPPILAADDLLAFSPHLDAVLLVAREGKTRKADLQRAMEMLKVVNVIGTMLNQVRDQNAQRY